MTSSRAYGVAPPGTALPEKTYVGGVRLQVSDLQRSLDYYQRVLGLRVYDSTRDAATLGPDGERRVLITLETSPGVTAGRRGAFGLYHFAILLPDRPALGRFATHLSNLNVRVGMADHLVSEALYLRDPDDLGIEVYADRPQKTWRHQNRELAMASDPLDISNVIAASGGVPWGGMPEGTTIGHMHLHVGDLDLAEAFYHRTLGFEKMVWSYPGALFLAAGGYHHHLATNTWAPGPSPHARHAQLLDWELIVPNADDVEAVAERASHAGYSSDTASGALAVRDPWGTIVRITQANG